MSDYDPTLSIANAIEPYDAAQTAQAVQNLNNQALNDAKKSGAPKKLPIPVALFQAMREYAIKVQLARASELRLNSKYAEYLSVLTQQNEWEALLEDVQPEMVVRCVDYTEGFRPDEAAATLEFNGYGYRADGVVNLVSGFFDWVRRAPDVWGQARSPKLNSPEGFCFNYAILPAWQKWRPFMRYGEILAINDYVLESFDPDNPTPGQDATCTVQLQTAVNEKININASEILSNVPVWYMSCNSDDGHTKDAFKVGDQVVVFFNGLQLDQPWVIGFQEHPRPPGANWTAVVVEWNTGPYRQLILVTLDHNFQVVQVRSITNTGQTFGNIRISLRGGIFWWSSYFVGGYVWVNSITQSPSDARPVALPTLQNDFKRVEMADSGWRRWIASFGVDANSTVLKPLTVRGYDSAGSLKDTIELRSCYWTNDAAANSRFFAISTQNVTQNDRDYDHYDFTVQVVDFGETPGVVSPSQSRTDFIWAWAIALSDDNVLAVSDFVEAKVYLYQLPGWALIGQIATGGRRWNDDPESGVFWYYNDVSITQDYLVVIKMVGSAGSGISYYRKGAVEWYRRPNLTTPVHTMYLDEVDGLPPVQDVAMTFKLLAQNDRGKAGPL